jgi:hypothetical protein
MAANLVNGELVCAAVGEAFGMKVADPLEAFARSRAK